MMEQIFQDSDLRQTPTVIQQETIDHHQSIGFEEVRYDKNCVSVYFRLSDGWVKTTARPVFDDIQTEEVKSIYSDDSNGEFYEVCLFLIDGVYYVVERSHMGDQLTHTGDNEHQAMLAWENQCDETKEDVDDMLKEMLEDREYEETA